MRPRSAALSILGALGVAALTTSSVAAGSATTTLANGADLTATITSPTTGDTFLTTAADVDVAVAGNASIGEGQPDVHWTYVIDVSGSTDALPCGSTNILACEKQAVLNLNADVVASGSAIDVGVAVYALDGASADMQSTMGEQPLTAPDSGDVEVVVNSAYSSSSGNGGVTQYTAKVVGFQTNFTAGLTAALNSVSASSAGTKNVVFLSDGNPIAGGSGFDAAVSALVNGQGANIYSFAVGDSSSCTSEGPNGSLQEMADAADAVNDGSCTEVPDPTDLPDIVTDVVATQMTGVGLTVDGNPVPLDSNSNPPPFDGPDSTDVTATAADQGPGAHEVCLSAEGTGPKGDPASADTATQCETYFVYGFSLYPDTATNELSQDDTHTVTASVSGEPGFLEDWPVEFTVTGTNAGATGTCVPADCATDASGEVTFTYSVPQVPASLGTDAISAKVTVNSEDATLSVSKDWVDTVVPVASCEPSVNPSGKKQPQAPGKGGRGQNQDGFYAVGATDSISGETDLEVFVTDTGSGTVFGPFSVDTNIKYTESGSATPMVKPIGGPNSAVEWHIIGTGDAEVTAIDSSGNVSSAANCLVPPPPK